MKTKNVFALFLLVTLLLASCTKSYPESANYVSLTPANMTSVNLTLNAIFATTPSATGTMTVTPLALTKTPTPTFTSTVTSAPPVPTTPTCTPTPVADSCPIAVQVAPGSAFNTYTFEAGKYYHINLSLEGASAGVEGNLFFRATSTFTATFDGAAWEYVGPVTTSTCQICDEISGDYTLDLNDVPQLTGLIEVLDLPCTTGIGSTTLPVHFLEVVQ